MGPVPSIIQLIYLTSLDMRKGKMDAGDISGYGYML